MAFSHRQRFSKAGRTRRRRCYKRSERSCVGTSVTRSIIRNPEVLKQFADAFAKRDNTSSPDRKHQSNAQAHSSVLRRACLLVPRQKPARRPIEMGDSDICTLRSQNELEHGGAIEVRPHAQLRRREFRTLNAASICCRHERLRHLFRPKDRRYTAGCSHVETALEEGEGTERPASAPSWYDSLGTNCSCISRPRGVVDKDQQRAGRRPVLEPGMITAIDLHQLAQARAAIARRVHPSAGAASAAPRNRRRS